MTHVVLVIHLILAVSIIGLVLIQRSEGGGLGIGGGGGLGGLATPQGTANALTKATGICAALFFITSLSLAVMTEGTRPTSITDHLGKAVAAGEVSASEEAAPAENSKEAKEATEPAKKADKKAPSVPVAE